MGGHAFYVWGSYVLTLAAMAGEVLLLLRRQRSLRRLKANRLRAGGAQVQV